MGHFEWKGALPERRPIPTRGLHEKLTTSRAVIVQATLDKDTRPSSGNVSPEVANVCRPGRRRPDDDRRNEEGWQQKWVDRFV